MEMKAISICNLVKKKKKNFKISLGAYSAFLGVGLFKMCG